VIISRYNQNSRTGRGKIKYGTNILEVKGRKLEKKDRMNNLIDKAYLSKYDQPENLVYSRGISQPEYADFTMEFLPIQI
jgi:hypothetical protein